MTQGIGIYTETMAKVYASQGHWANAVAIYRHLLAESPTRGDWAEALADAEKSLKTSSGKSSRNLEALFGEWIELLFRYKKIKKLKSLTGRAQGRADN